MTAAFYMLCILDGYVPSGLPEPDENVLTTGLNLTLSL
jgi:hypothetical protein